MNDAVFHPFEHSLKKIFRELERMLQERDRQMLICLRLKTKQITNEREWNKRTQPHTFIATRRYKSLKFNSTFTRVRVQSVVE